MRKRLVLSLMLLFCALFAASAHAADTVKFDLTRIYYDDALRTVNYDFSGGSHSSSWGNDNYTVDDSSGTYSFVDYRSQSAPYADYGLKMTFQHREYNAGNPNTRVLFDFGTQKATYEFQKPSQTDLNQFAQEGYPINFSCTEGSNIGNPNLAVDNWFYSMRVQNFQGFEPHYFNEFEFSMLPPNDKKSAAELYYEGRIAMPAFRLSAKWVEGLYRGKKFGKTLILSAKAQRYGIDVPFGENDPGAQGAVFWESEVGGVNPAKEIAMGSRNPEDTILDLAVNVETDDANNRSLVKLYYRLYDENLDTPSATMKNDGSWELFHTIPIPYVSFTKSNASVMTVKFPGMPVTLGSYKVRSEAIAFEPTDPSQGSIITVGVEAIDKTALGIKGFSPISPEESFKLTGITPEETVVLRYGLSGKAFGVDKKIKVSEIKMKKILPSGNLDFNYNQVGNAYDLADGEWCLTLPSGPNSVCPTTSNVESDKQYYVYFAIKDGGRFDLDGAKNGEIVDPSILGVLDASPSGDGGNTPSNPTPSTSAVISNFSFTLGGVGYTATEQPDGSLLIVVPYGTDVTQLAPTFTLPAGATCVPASGTPQDFTKPVTYTVTAADGKTTQTYTIVVKVESAPENTVERELVSPAASLWRVFLTINPDGTVGVRIVAPFTGGAIPDHLYATLNGLSNARTSVVDADGKTVVSYTARGSNGYSLVIEGTAPSRTAADAVVVKSLAYWLPSDTTEYKQTLGTTGIPVAKMTLAGVTDNSGQGKSGGSSGCDAGVGFAAVVLGLIVVRRQSNNCLK